VAVVKLANSSDNIQAAVILHPGSIIDKEFNGKLVIFCFLVIDGYPQPYGMIVKKSHIGCEMV
jgi:hypothetical protein